MCCTTFVRASFLFTLLSLWTPLLAVLFANSLLCACRPPLPCAPWCFGSGASYLSLGDSCLAKVKKKVSTFLSWCCSCAKLFWKQNLFPLCLFAVNLVFSLDMFVKHRVHCRAVHHRQTLQHVVKLYQLTSFAHVGILATSWVWKNLCSHPPLFPAQFFFSTHLFSLTLAVWKMMAPDSSPAYREKIACSLSSCGIHTVSILHLESEFCTVSILHSCLSLGFLHLGGFAKIIRRERRTRLRFFASKVFNLMSVYGKM